MKRFLAFVTLALILCMPAMALTDAWHYVQDISVPAGNQPAKLYLSTDILSNARTDGQDFRIAKNGVEEPIKLFLEGTFEQQQTIAGVQASSTRPDFRSTTYSASNLLDGDQSMNDNAYFQIDATIDQEIAWIVVDMGESLLTSKAIFTAKDTTSTFVHVQVEGSNDKSSWTLLKRKTAASGGVTKTVVYAPSSFRYVRFTFWHVNNLILNELKMYGESKGYILFMADASAAYQLFYGNPASNMPEYDVSALYLEAETPEAHAQGERVNPLYDADTDNDGVAADNCPYTENPDQKDSDNDGIGDACDNCRNAKNENQRDWDNDGFGDSCDNCANNYNPNQLDKDLDGVGYICDDWDGDGVINSVDNCVEGSNRDQADTNRNLIGDVCEDDDADGTPNYADNCPEANADQADEDKDGVGDMCDNCPTLMNANQRDADGNGVGDVCEDVDRDGAFNAKDNCPDTPNADQIDWDKDGFGDVCDNCPNHANKDQRDIDRDEIGDVCDEEESRILENKSVVWGIMILAILVVGYLAFALSKSAPK